MSAAERTGAVNFSQRHNGEARQLPARLRLAFDDRADCGLPTLMSMPYCIEYLGRAAMATKRQTVNPYRQHEASFAGGDCTQPSIAESVENRRRRRTYLLASDNRVRQ